jgi:hypothetical protein
MDEPEFTMPFCLVLSLIGEYRSQDFHMPANLNTFLGWLADHDHSDVVELIANDPEVSAAVWELLESQLAYTLAEMSILDSKVIDVSLTDRFGRLAKAIQTAYE